MRKIKFLLSTLVLLMVAALPVNAVSWTVAGSSAALNGTSDWAVENTDNDMTSGDGTNFTLVVTDCTLETGTTYKFKIVKDHAWSEAYPASDYEFTVAETAVYTVEYSFNADSKEVDVNTTKTGEAGVIVHTYTIAGVAALMGNGWAADDTNHDMITNDDTNYTLTLSNKYLATGTYEYKVVQDHSWGVSFPPSNAQLVVSHNGYYNVVFTFNANNQEVNATVTPVPYIVDFNTAITTSDHAFQVASNWRHIVDYYEYWGDPYYPSYSYNATAGIGGGGALSCITNQKSNSIYDLLVTPVVKGTVTIAAKQTDSYYTPLLEFYKIIDNGDGTFTRGDKIDVDVSAINTTDYVTITIPVAEGGERIGIRSSYVWLDNFTAEEAIIAPEAKITIASAVPTATTGTIYWEQQPNGKVLVSYTVTVTNNGEVDLTQGAEGFSVSIINGSTGDVYSTVAVPQDLAVGETSDEFVVSAEVETSIWPNSYTYIQMNLKENLFGQVVERAQSHYTAYEPKFVFRKAGSTSTSSISSAEAWGTITESTTKNYEIFNNGTAPLTINSIQIPKGFKGSPSVLERADEYNASGAVWYAWTWNDGEEGTWVAEDEGKFTGLKKNVTFVRMNPNATEIPSMDAKWNQTEDLVTNAGMTYVIDSWTGGADGKLGGHWAAAVVAKGETKAINITNDASVTGTFADDDLVIKYLDKNADEQTYSLAFSTTVIGPNTWTADFNNTTSTVVYPAGSVAEAGIDKDYQYISSGNYNNWLIGRNTSSYATENNKFITPKLHATAGEKLTFDVKAGYSSTDAYFVKVYVSSDRKTWGEPVETYVNSNTGSSFTTKTITFAEEGDYYVAFALYGSGSGIDNLVGLEKVDVAHDLYIKSVNWPDASIKSGTAQTKPSVDIIPLTDETAEAYTVKYVCGETVLAEGTPVALTASASSTKTFSFSWTPEVVSTTVYENTKVVFDFGGGVTFETDPFNLTVTNEPIFHFVKAIPASKWYEPTDYTTPITFGKTNTADTQTFYVYNWGTAPLTVKSISVPEGFTVTPTEQFNVVAFDENNLSASSQAVTITFSAATPGNYSGNMVITYENDQTFEIAVSGTRLDPTKWYANFDDQQWPAGSVYQDNVSISFINTGNYGLMSSSATNNIFITPKLTAAANDVIQFDASTRNSYYNGTVKVYISDNRENLGDPVKEIELSKVDNVAMSTYEYQFAAAGDYYVAFALEEARVDEIYGLAPVAVEHDWMIASSNIPTDAMQNVAKNASVNVLNLGLADEAADSYEVNLYIGGEKAASAETTPALAMNHKFTDAGTQVTVPMQSPKAGTFPVYIEVKAGAYSIATEPVNVTFAEEEAKSEATAEADGVSTSIPLNLSYYNSESVSLFTSDILASSYGLSNGAKIKSITFKGYKTTEATTSTFNVWYEWTDDASQSKPDNGLYTTEGMTQIVTDQEKTWPNEGSSSNMVDFITLNFGEPLVYQSGKSLRIVMRSNSTQWKAANFEQAVYSTNGLTYYHYNDTKSTFESNSWSSGRLPVMHIALEAEPKTYSGTVKDDSGNAIENATVTLVSTEDNIQYSGITDENGVYSINVIQSSRTYDATATAYGYDDAADDNISFADKVVKNFELTRKAEVSVTVTSAEWATITTPATYAVSFDENTEVYIATGEEGGNIKLTKIDDAPAMTPIVIHATAGSYTMTQIASATSTSIVSANNILESAKGNEVGDGAGNYYVLGMTSTGVGFGKLASGVTLAKGKAYIPGTALANIADFLPFVIGDEDETTTINAVDAAGMDDDTPVYNLAGQKVGKDYKGVVIVNGRKVVRK